MAIVAPLRGLTYNFYQMHDFSKVVAPPYDVISPEKQEAYYKAHPYNVIRLILGRKKTGDSDWDNRYTRAADFFSRWQSENALIRAERPSVYVTCLTYDPGDGGPMRTRYGFIALVKIEDENSGVILPHERTFSAHKDDRLKLMRACKAQFSQIFGLYEDKGNIVTDACREAMDFPPHVTFDFEDDTQHRMWILQRPALSREIADVMSDKRIFIADGHHRYETARNFRNLMRARHGQRPVDRSFEYVMMYLTNMYDEGLTILPSHRLVKRVPHFKIEAFLEKVQPWFDIRRLPMSGKGSGERWPMLGEVLQTEGARNTAIAFYEGRASHCFCFVLKPGVRDEMGDDLHPSLKKLDVLVLSRFILQKALGFTKTDLDNERIFHYESNMAQAGSLVESGDFQMAFFLNPTKIEHVKEIAGHQLVMPRKSTYFYPKILTGLVFNKIDPHEIIQMP